VGLEYVDGRRYATCWRIGRDLMNWLSIVFGPIIDVVGSYIKHKQEITKLEREGEIKAKQSVIDGETEWDKIQASNGGWKDEYLTVVLSIPLIACFIPGLEAFVLRGFAILETTPTWYQAAIGVMIAAAFGIKSFAKFMEVKKGE